MSTERRQWQWTVDSPSQAVDWLAAQTGLSRSRIKMAMTKGAVTLKRGRQGRKRLRRATFGLRAGDRLELYYDPEILARTLQTQPDILEQDRDIAVIYKPPGWLSQGSPWGDHLSVERWLQCNGVPDVHLVHRLDRETAGLMLIARHRRAAGQLSQLFQAQRIDKIYRARVAGACTACHAIRLPLDGKPAVSHVRPLIQDAPALLEVRLETGRLHQIRRHLEHIDLPVLGDPAYGEGNAHPDGLHLVAWSIQWPWNGRQRRAQLPARYQPDWAFADE